MPLSEYNMRMTAARLKKADALDELATLALFIRKSQIADRNGKYLVQSVTDLVDVPKLEAEEFNESLFDDATHNRLWTIYTNLQEYNKKGGG